jgi:hypothetical protein
LLGHWVEGVLPTSAIEAAIALAVPTLAVIALLLTSLLTSGRDTSRAAARA